MAVHHEETGIGIGMVIGIIVAVLLAVIILWYVLGSTLFVGGGNQPSQPPQPTAPSIQNPPAQPGGGTQPQGTPAR